MKENKNHWYPRPNATRIMEYKGVKYAGWQMGVLIQLAVMRTNRVHAKRWLDEFLSQMHPKLRVLALAIYNNDKTNETAKSFIEMGNNRCKNREMRWANKRQACFF